MLINDLTTPYQDRYLRYGDRTGYEEAFPELFDHYYRFWARREDDIVEVDENELNKRRQWIIDLINGLKTVFEDNGIYSDNIDYVLMIGVGTTNGHAFRFNDKYYVWLPLETYTTKELVKIFVTHEIIHALHYYGSPDFYFKSKDEQIQTSRQLITEGLATYFTRELLGMSDREALWADFLDDEAAAKWLDSCHREERGLFKLIFKNFYESNEDLWIFYAADAGDIYQYRSGYYAGLRLVEKYAEINELTLKQLLKLPREKFEKDINQLLESLIK